MIIIIIILLYKPRRDLIHLLQRSSKLNIHINLQLNMGYRGQRHHLKRVNAPHHWMLGKLDGIWVRIYIHDLHRHLNHQLVHTKQETAFLWCFFSETGSNTLLTCVKSCKLLKIVKVKLKLTENSEKILTIHLDSWMSFPSKRQAIISDFYSMLKEDLLFIKLKSMKRLTNYAKLRERESARIKFHTSLPTTAEQSDTHTPTSISTTPLNTTSMTEKSKSISSSRAEML